MPLKQMWNLSLQFGLGNSSKLLVALSLGLVGESALLKDEKEELEGDIMTDLPLTVMGPKVHLLLCA